MLMKFILVLIVNYLGNTGDLVNVTELTESEKRKLSDLPEKLPSYILDLENAILHMISGSTYGIDYYYKCDGFPDNLDFNKPFISSQSDSNSDFKYGLVENGIIVKSICGVSKKIEYEPKELQQYYLRTCAKSEGVNAFNMEYKFEIEKLDYVQWCILNETPQNVEILEYFKITSKKLNKD